MLGEIQQFHLTIKEDNYDPKTVWSFSFHKTQIDLATKNLSKPSEWWTSTKETDPAIANNIKMWLNNNGYANKEIKIIAIPTFSLYDRGSGGRVKKGDITVDFIVKDLTDSTGKLIPQHISFSDVSASKLRAMVGNRTMLSYLIDEVNNDTKITLVKGRGDGHGVGMSQWGAKYMADAGKTYEEILKFYYTNISIAKLYNPLPKTSSPLPIEPIKQALY